MERRDPHRDVAVPKGPSSVPEPWPPSGLRHSLLSSSSSSSSLSVPSRTRCRGNDVVSHRRPWSYPMRDHRRHRGAEISASHHHRHPSGRIVFPSHRHHHSWKMPTVGGQLGERPRPGPTADAYGDGVGVVPSSRGWRWSSLRGCGGCLRPRLRRHHPCDAVASTLSWLQCPPLAF